MNMNLQQFRIVYYQITTSQSLRSLFVLVGLLPGHSKQVVSYLWHRTCVCLSVYLSVYLSVCLFVYLSVFLSVCVGHFLRNRFYASDSFFLSWVAKTSSLDSAGGEYQINHVGPNKLFRTVADLVYG